MPEIITKYPDIVLQVLKGAGVDCGTGATQRILAACPPERFCSLPTGEICVYGLNEIPQMTQVSVGEFTGIVSTVTRAPLFYLPEIFLSLLILGAGIVIGVLAGKWFFKKKK